MRITRELVNNLRYEKYLDAGFAYGGRVAHIWRGEICLCGYRQLYGSYRPCMVGDKLCKKCGIVYNRISEADTAAEMR